MSRPKEFGGGMKKQKLIALLTDILDSSNNPQALARSLKTAKQTMLNHGLWTSLALPVVDGDKDADIYGYATSPHYAKVIAEECFANPVHRVKCYGPVTLQDGTKLPEAYVVTTKPRAEAQANA